MRTQEAPHQARAALGAELAAYRRAAGCTQAQLARLTEYSRSTIANVETGRQHVPCSFCERADGWAAWVECSRRGGHRTAPDR